MQSEAMELRFRASEMEGEVAALKLTNQGLQQEAKIHVEEMVHVSEELREATQESRRLGFALEEKEGALMQLRSGEGERKLERSESKSIAPPSYITNNLLLVASFLVSPFILTLSAIRFAHRRV